MIVKIDNQERTQLEKICAIFDLTCRIYTMENTAGITQAEILHVNGDELKPETAWYLCASIQLKVAMNN